MPFLFRLYRSSIGKKLLVALTGLLLIVFLVAHLLGNLLLFKNDGGAAFDRYSEALEGNVFINIVEVALALTFLGHIVTTTILWIQNRRARPVQYEIHKSPATTTIASRMMYLTGGSVFIFLVLHLNSFTIAGRFRGSVKPSMYALVVETFAQPGYVLLYVVAITFLGYHLRHGFQSALQTFGIKSPRYSRVLNLFGMVFWLLIPLGFVVIPLYVLIRS